MNALRRISIFFIVFALAEARVTFPFSEVLQAYDLAYDWESYAPFRCDDGCKVYVDLSSDDLAVYEWAQDTGYVTIVNFTDIVGEDPAHPVGYELQAGKSYGVYFPAGVPYNSSDYEWQEFTFYAVSVKSPSYGAPVVSVQNGTLFTIDKSRYLTVLSSFDALQYSGFSGRFSTTYPQIFATGFDAIDYATYHRTSCVPVYQARSQYNAEQSEPIVFAPISTIDFGYSDVYKVSAIPIANARNPPYAHSSGASTVYMTPGYIGCPFEIPQHYRSSLDDEFGGPYRAEVRDGSTTVCDSLDINAVYWDVSITDKVKLRVNADVLDFYSNTTSKSFVKSYGAGAYAVYIEWDTEAESTSAWSIQMDFGGSAPTTPTTTEFNNTEEETNSTLSNLLTTLTSTPTTTTSAGELSHSLAVIIVFAFASYQ